MDIKRLEPLILAGQATEAQMAEIGLDRVASIKTAPQAVNLRAFAGETKQLGPRRFEFAMSSERPDHVGDVLKSDGWDTSVFAKNPVGMWGHGRQTDIPIGTWPMTRKGVDLGGGIKGLVGEFEFAPEGAFELADTIHRLTEAGVVKATSVGLRFLETPKLTQAEREEMGLGAYGVYSARHLLLECSLVSVPMNPDALARSCDELLTKGLVQRGGVEQVLKTVPVTERDWANVIRELCGKSYPAAVAPVESARGDAEAEAEPEVDEPLWVGSLTEKFAALRRDFSSLSSRIDAATALASTQAEAIRKLADANERLAGGARPLGSDPGNAGAKGNAEAEPDPAVIEKAIDAALGNVRRAAKR